MINVESKENDFLGATALGSPSITVMVTLFSPHPLLRAGGLAGGGERHRQACPQLASPSTYWQQCTNQGVPRALLKPGQEDWVPKLCASAPRTNRGSARKGSRSHAFGNHWINATVVLEGSTGKALESLKARLTHGLQHSLPVPRFPPLYNACIIRAHCAYEV